MHRFLVLAAVLVGLALSASPAFASGGRYTFSGGTASQRAAVRSALDASTFDWGVVPGTVKIVVARGLQSEAVPGEIRLDADLLDSGQFSWSVVQHEYAHQVDFLLLDDATRALLAPRVGGRAWWGDSLAHGDQAGERFASTLAWAFWPVKANTMRPTKASDEAGSIAPAAFRALLASVLPTVRTTASARVR